MRLVFSGAVAVAMVAGLFSACGGTAISNLNDDGGPNDGGGAIDSGPTVGPCPAQESAGPGACTIPGLVCEYGNDPRPSCKDKMVCNENHTWSLSQVDCAGPDPFKICPATLAEIKPNSACTADATCDFADGQCICEIPYFGGPSPVDAGSKVWVCAPKPAANCPAKRPNLGTNCSSEKLECVYGSGCSMGSFVVCKNGYWQDEPVACAL